MPDEPSGVVAVLAVVAVAVAVPIGIAWLVTCALMRWLG